MALDNNSVNDTQLKLSLGKNYNFYEEVSNENQNMFTDNKKLKANLAAGFEEQMKPLIH